MECSLASSLFCIKGKMYVSQFLLNEMPAPQIESRGLPYPDGASFLMFFRMSALRGKLGDCLTFISVCILVSPLITECRRLEVKLGDCRVFFVPVAHVPNEFSTLFQS